MKIRQTLLRGAAVVALGSAFIGASVLAPVAAASPLDNGTAVEAVKSTMNKPNIGEGLPIPSGDLPLSPGGLPIDPSMFSEIKDVEDVPIIGDMVGTFKDAEPEEIVTGAVELGSAAAETIVPVIRGFIRK